MASHLNPYLYFNGDAEEAMGFYREVFGGTLQVNTFAEFGSTDEFADKIMHSQLETPSGLVFMGSDMPPGTPSASGPGRIGLILHGDDETALRGWFERLAEGGSITVPLEPSMWGDVYGQCTDRFGIEWMVNITVPSND